MPVFCVRLADLRDGSAVYGRLDARRAVRAWLRGDFKSGRGRIALVLTVISWGLLGLIMYRNVKSEPYFETPLARDARRRLRGDRRTVAAGPTTTRPGRRATARIDPPPVRREGGHRHVRPAPRVNVADIWRRARPAARRQGAGAAAGARRRVDDRHAPTAGLPADEPPRRARLGVRVDRLPRQPAAHLARPHRRRQARAGVDQGAHRRIRRRPRLRRDHRRLGGRPPVPRWRR